MAFPADFSDAHLRHWQDAELLRDAGRWANADQLYGFSTECGLKAVMRTHGMSVDAMGTPTEGRQKQHIQTLWDVFVAFVHGRPIANVLHRLPQTNPFQAWSHNNRYANGRHFDGDAVAPHREGARLVRQVCLRLRISGHV